MRLFVGSSTKQVVLSRDGRSIDHVATKAKPIGTLVEGLRKKGHDVEPWWEDGTFQGGRNLLECLIEKARTCDGGIFVMRKDDSLALAKGSKPIGVPRGNVILECGMFLAAKGKESTYIIKDGPYNKISWPTDILGTLMADLEDPNLCDDAHTFFTRGKTQRHNAASEVFINGEMMRSVFRRECSHWSTKGLYVGVESARRWTDIESGDDYLQDRNTVANFIEHVHQEKNIPISFERIDNIISLGPGCGVFDNSVVSKVAEFRPDIAYIPIDINPQLAREAAEHITTKNPRVRTPFAIIDDFETHSEHIGNVVKRRISDYRQVNVFVMLGGTFSNLEGVEHDIVQKFKAWMDHNDFLIVDAFIKSRDYSFQDDTKVHVPNLPDPYKQFLINACISKCVCAAGGDVSIKTQQMVASIANNLSSVLTAGEVSQATRGRYTELLGTSVTAYCLKLGETWPGMRKEMLIAKRYDDDEIHAFMKKHFDVLYHFSDLENRSKGRAMFLLRNRGQ